MSTLTDKKTQKTAFYPVCGIIKQGKSIYYPLITHIKLLHDFESGMTELTNRIHDKLIQNMLL